MTHYQKIYLFYFVAGFFWGIGAGILLTLRAEKGKRLATKAE